MITIEKSRVFHNMVTLELTVEQVQIIAHNLDLQMYDVQDINDGLEDDEKYDTELIKESCTDILAECQAIGIWGNLPMLNEEVIDTTNADELLDKLNNTNK